MCSSDLRIALVETRLKAGEDEERRLAAERDEAAAAVERARNDRLAAQRTLASLTDSIERAEREGAEAAGEAASLEERLAEARRRIEALDSELSGFGELPDNEENSSVVGGLRSELSLAGERLRGMRAVAERMDREHGTLTARIAEALEELRAGESEERAGREALSRIGRECLSVHRDETELRRKLEEERGRVRRGRLRLAL